MIKHDTKTGKVFFIGPDGKRRLVIERDVPFLTPEQIKEELEKQKRNDGKRKPAGVQ